MTIDLSFLDDSPAPAPAATADAPAAAPAAAPQAHGKAVEFPIDGIDEDADQPRTEFDEEALQELAASIKQRGVLSPISIRPHPDKPNRWVINHGHRRYRASVIAGKKTIPAHVSHDHDDYDQVVENLLRDNLTPLEIARIIQRKIEGGESKQKVAKRLSKPGHFVTHHLALIDLPDCIASAYTEGKSRSPQTLYNLRALYDKSPERVAEWCAEQAEITRASVEEFAQEIAGKGKKPKPGAGNEPAEKPEGEGSKHLPMNKSDSAGGEANEGEQGGAGQAKSKTEHLPPGTEDGVGEGTSTKPKPSDPDAISRPLLIVEFDGRAAAVLLNRRPSAAGLIRIKYEDGGGEEEVDAGQCKINRLMDGSP